MKSKSIARIIGILYLLTILTPILGNAIFNERQIDAHDVPTTLQVIGDNRFGYQLSISLDFLSMVGVMALAFSLYILLKPVNPYLAWLALGWRIGEVLLQVGGTIPNYLLLSLAKSTQIGLDEMVTISRLMILGAEKAVWLSFVFFSLGSVFNNYLFYKSKILPSFLGVYGLISTGLYALGSILALFIEISETANMVMMLPLVLFEVSLGMYLTFFKLKELPMKR